MGMNEMAEKYFIAMDKNETSKADKYAEELIIGGTALIRKIINFLWKDSPYDEDLLQEGRLALFKALKKYNPSRGNDGELKGAQFATYAYNSIKNAIIMFLRKNRNTFGTIKKDLIQEDTTLGLLEYEEKTPPPVRSLSLTNADTINHIVNNIPEKYQKTFRVWQNLESGKKPTASEKIMCLREMKKVAKRENITQQHFRNSMTDIYL